MSNVHLDSSCEIVLYIVPQFIKSLKWPHLCFIQFCLYQQKPFTSLNNLKQITKCEIIYCQFKSIEVVYIVMIFSLFLSNITFLILPAFFLKIISYSWIFNWKYGYKHVISTVFTSLTSVSTTLSRSPTLYVHIACKMFLIQSIPARSQAIQPRNALMKIYHEE